MIGLGHLGARMSALVDETLDGEDLRRALAHLEECAGCRRAVADERLQRRMTGSLGTPALPGDLRDRLLAVPTAPAVAPVTGAGVDWTSHRRRSRAPRVVLASAASVVGMAVLASGTLYAVGAPRPRTPEAITAGVAATAAAVPATRSGLQPQVSHAVVTPVGWPSGVAQPTVVPGEVVAADTLPGGVVRVDVTVDGEVVTVLEGHGRLDVSAVAVEETLDLDGAEAYRIGEWWFAQSGGDVVAVTGPQDACEQVLRAFEDAGVSAVDRVVAGWFTVIGGLE